MFIKARIPGPHQETLLKMCETHWVERCESLLRFEKLYSPITYALKEFERH